MTDIATLATLLLCPVKQRIILTPSLLVATLNFRKRLGHPNDAVAILADVIGRERVAAFDWLGAGVEDGGEGAGETWVYFLRVPRKLVVESAPRLVDAVAHAYSTACATIQTHPSTEVVQ